MREATDHLKWEIFKFLVHCNCNNWISWIIYEKEFIETIIANNKLDTLKFLVTNNFNLNREDEEGNIPLIYAIKSKNIWYC